MDSQIIRHEKAIHRYWIIDLSHVFGIREEACEQFCSHTVQLAETQQRHFYYCCSFSSNGCYSHRVDWLYGLFFQNIKTSVSFLSSSEVFSREQHKTLLVQSESFLKGLKRPYALRKFISHHYFQTDPLITSVWHTRWDTCGQEKHCHFSFLHFQIVMDSNTVMRGFSNFFVSRNPLT